MSDSCLLSLLPFPFPKVTIREVCGGDEGSESSLEMFSEEPSSWPRNRFAVTSSAAVDAVVSCLGPGSFDAACASLVMAAGPMSAYMLRSIAALVSQSAEMGERNVFVSWGANFSSASVGTTESIDAGEKVESTIHKGLEAKYSWVDLEVLRVPSCFVGRDPSWLRWKYTLSQSCRTETDYALFGPGRMKGHAFLWQGDHLEFIFMNIYWRTWGCKSPLLLSIWAYCLGGGWPPPNCI